MKALKMAETEFRSPICTVVGHVDVGKTSLLDLLRGSSVQAKEAGGITQRLGVTFLSQEYLNHLNEGKKKGFSLPGLMFIDTPGHECFTSQRLAGIGISDMVVILVDVFKGLEQQTIECIELLKKSKTPFLVAVNKIDRIGEWESTPMASLKTVMEKQKEHVKRNLIDYLNNIKVQLAENYLNAEVYFKNKNPKEFISIVPISSKTGEGLYDMLMLLDFLTTHYLTKRITIHKDRTNGFLLERVKDNHLGDVYTCLLTNGTLVRGGKILTMDSKNEVVEGRIKQILVPEDQKEIKDKIHYQGVPSLTASQSCVLKLEGAEFATGVRFSQPSSEEEYNTARKRLEEMEHETDELELSKNGVFISAPTKGMIDGLVTVCKDNDIPIAGFNIGPITQKYIKKVQATKETFQNKTEDDRIYNQRYSCILVFEEKNKIEKRLIKHAKDVAKVKLFCSEIVYRLVEKYDKYRHDLGREMRKRNPHIVEMVELTILPEHIYNKKSPLVFGVRVNHGKLTVGQTFVAHKDGKNNQMVGSITDIHKNSKSVEEAETHQEVCIKISSTLEFGKQFDEHWTLSTHYSEEDKRLIDMYPDVFGEIKYNH